MPEFRLLKRGDIPDLIIMSRENMAAIVLASWGVEWQDEPLLEWLADKDIRTMVLEKDGEAIGYYSLEFVDNYIFITSIQVRKDHQGEGIGKLMMDNIEALAQAEDVEGVELCVQDTNFKAKGFYDHIGYSTICRRGNNYLMRKRLRTGQN
jgi:ribosomal protein S18 acetylase RimI-like enzyme